MLIFSCLTSFSSPSAKELQSGTSDRIVFLRALA